MKLSTKFVLMVTSTFVVAVSLITGLFFLGALSMSAENIETRTRAIYTFMEPVLDRGDKAEIQQIMSMIQAEETDLKTFEVYKVEAGNATVISSYDPALVGTPPQGKDAEYVQSVLSTGEEYGALGDDTPMFIPFNGADNQIKYVVGLHLSYSDIAKPANQLTTTVLSICGVLLLIIIAIFWFSTNRMLKKPLTRLIGSANQIASGNLLVEFGKEIGSKDEIGQLARAVRDMSNNLKQMIGKINDSAQQVAASAEQLTAGAEQTSQATEHIVETVEEVAIGSEKQVSSVEESSEIIREMSIAVNRITEHAESASDTAMTASDVAVEGNLAIQTVMKQMNSINVTVRDLHEMVKRLGNRSQEIGQIVQVITGIAEQTNLLALNAAIEAARAGENGRGFSVVADEVRKLAVQSATSGQQITQLVESIQVETNDAVLSMETGTKEVAEGISVVNRAGESFSRIQEAINEVVTQMQSVSAAVVQMTAGADRVVDSIQVIANVAEETAGNTQLVSASTQEQLASMNEIAQSSIALNGMAEELQSLVNNFKL